MPAPAIADPTGDGRGWHCAPGWPAAARKTILMPAAVDPSFTGRHKEGPA
jgi:hypothetical protein